MKNLKAIHPLLFACFPILSIFAGNIAEVQVQELFLPLLISVISTAVLWLLLRGLLSDLHKAAIATSVFVVLFFSYGHVIPYVSDTPTGGIEGALLLLSFSLIFFLVVYRLRRSSKDFAPASQGLFMASLFLVVFPCVTGAQYWLQSKQEGLASTDSPETPDGKTPESKANQSLPSIYYIIADGYARSDVLKDLYDFDNEPFLSQLESLGFYVARSARANYCQTYLSLSSSLNLTYLDFLVEEHGHKALAKFGKVPLRKMIEKNKVFAFLKEHGYRTIAFSSGYHATDNLKTADIYLKPRLSLSEFQNILLETTPLVWLSARVAKISPYDLHRSRILYTFDHLADFAADDVPSFVFAHVLSPHAPFVFGENGEPTDDQRQFDLHEGSSYKGDKQQYVNRYRAQNMFITKQLQKAVTQILSKSKTPPIIIVQSDHGPGSRYSLDDVEKTYLRERMSILNAYYFPDKDYSALYQTITPVNSFAVVLNKFFAADHKLLPDRTFFSAWKEPYLFIDVTDRMNANPDS